MSSTSKDHKQTTSNARKYLVFKLNEHLYGVPLSDVKEIIGLPNVVPVPQNPEYVLGLINLRGRVISAIDLKTRMMIKSQNDVKRPAVVLIEEGTTIVGCVVDSIQEVLSIRSDEIDNATTDPKSPSAQYTRGAARFTDKPMILILDMKKLANLENLTAAA